MLLNSPGPIALRNDLVFEQPAFDRAVEQWRISGWRQTHQLQHGLVGSEQASRPSAEFLFQRVASFGYISNHLAGNCAVIACSRILFHSTSSRFFSYANVKLRELPGWIFSDICAASIRNVPLPHIRSSSRVPDCHSG